MTLNAAEIGMFAVLLFLAVAVFAKDFYRLFAVMCLGRWENRFDHLWARLRGMVLYAFGQRRVLDEKFGVNHFLIFWGFMVLLLVNAQFLAAGLFPDFSLKFLGPVLYPALLVAADIMSLLVLAAAIVAAARRIAFRPAHVAPTLDAFVILSLIGVLMIAYFGLNACELGARTVEGAGWMPISSWLSGLVAGFSAEKLHLAARLFWWAHALALLFFLTYLPRGKHLHILAAIPNCFFRSLEFVRTVPRMVFQKGHRFGVSKVFQFTWKDLLDFYSCTECGRCQACCPAHNTGKALNPKEVVHVGKLNLLANGPQVLVGRTDTLASASDDAPTAWPLIGTGGPSVSPDAIWACTTCGACMNACPVFIEHVPKLIGMRRHLVMEKAAFPAELTNLFENTEQRFNPWGIAPAERVKWAHEHQVRVMADDAKVDYLFFVGCSGAFDSRSRQTALALAKIFNQAGLSWGILGNREKCCGDPLRRLGNEYVFDMLARENVQLFKRHAIRQVITFCPHCFSTLKHDYAQFGADFEVVHHTQLIADLLRQGRLRLSGRAQERIVFHDSCYLGRYNGVLDEPREVLAAATGQRPLEAPRCRQNSFCCGAGGGRMWMDEDVGQATYLARTREVLALEPATIAVACPYCMTMFEDGLRDENATGKVKVRDVAEIVVEAMRPSGPTAGSA
jgi:Fe-S oxidoreductase